MRIPRHPTLLRRMIQTRVRELVARCPPLAACLGRQRSGGWQVTWKERGKTRTVYVPQDLKEEVERWIGEHRRLRRLVAEITRLQLALIRGHRTWRDRRGGRR